MSNSSRSDNAGLNDVQPHVPLPESLSRPVVGLAFWAAITLPFLYLPLLITGLETTGMTYAFLVLLGLNVVTLVIGHSHGSG